MCLVIVEKSNFPATTRSCRVGTPVAVLIRKTGGQKNFNGLKPLEP